MSANFCPNCGERGFTWSIDEEVSRLTQWYCSICEYSASEDEAQASTCPTCGAGGANLLLSDTGGGYRFCIECRARTGAGGVA
jgi:hypothetical protein